MEFPINLAQPAAGMTNVIVTLSGKDRFAAGATSFFGVNQTQPFGVFNTYTGTAFTPSITVASAPGEVVIDSVAVHAATSGTNGTGQILLWNKFTGSASANVWGSSSFKAGAANVPMSWTLSGTGAGEWVAGAMALKPAVRSVVNNTAPRMTTNGFICQLSGPTPATYIVLASTNFITWTPVATNIVLSGALQFTDSMAAIYPFRFYWAVVQ